MNPEEQPPQAENKPLQPPNSEQAAVPTLPTPPAEPVQPIVSPITQPLNVADSSMGKKSSKRKFVIFFRILIGLILLGGGAAAYYFVYFVPNMPEVVLNNAVISFVEKPGNYNVSGKLDQAGPNDPDFDYKMTTVSSGNASTELYMSTFLQHPHFQTVKNGGKLYMQFSGFEDFKTMAKHYRNSGAPGIQ